MKINGKPSKNSRKSKKTRCERQFCGHDVASCGAALQRCGGDLHAAAELLLKSPPLDVLVNMGFEAQKARRALQSSSGDIQKAVELLQEERAESASKNCL